jgi:hypothetical protein
VDFAEPNSKEILLRLHHLSVWANIFADTKFLSAPLFCLRQLFIDAKFLSTPSFCRRLVFIDT